MNAKRCLRYGSWLVGVSALALSLTGARWVFSGAGGGDQAAPADDPFVVCFGHVDVEGGVLSLSPLQPGRVLAVDVREGDQVGAGRVLLRLDEHLAGLRVAEARADVTAARELLDQALRLCDRQQALAAQQRAAIDAMRHRLAGARHVLARKQELEKAQHLNPKEVAIAEELVQELEAGEAAEQGKLRELETHDPRAEVNRARANLEAAESRLGQARRVQEECLLRAPRDGTVLRVLVGPGEVPVGRPAVLFCPDRPRLVRAEVDQEFAGRVAVGQAARVQDDSTAGPTWQGEVVRVSDWYTQRRSVLPEPTQFNDVRTLECWVALAPGRDTPRIGQRVRVTIGRQVP
jgi:multidrug resistance efflux pump